MAHGIQIPMRCAAPSSDTETVPPRSLKLLSVRAAANYYDVSQQTVRRLIKSGKLKTYRVGRQIRLDEADLIDCITCHHGE